jgi:hypothetical protein
VHLRLFYYIEDMAFVILLQNDGFFNLNNDFLPPPIYFSAHVAAMTVQEKIT